MIGQINNKPGSGGGGGASKIVYRELALNFMLAKQDLPTPLSTFAVTVAAGEGIILQSSYFVNGVSGLVNITKYLFKNNGPSTVYNAANPINIKQLVELSTAYPNNENIDAIAASPKVYYNNLGVKAGPLFSYLNGLGTAFNFSDSTFNYYFRVTINEIDYLYQFAGATASRGFASYGGANPGFVESDFIVFYSSAIAVQQLFQNFQAVLQRGAVSTVGFEINMNSVQTTVNSLGVMVKSLISGTYTRLHGGGIVMPSTASFRSDFGAEIFTNNRSHKLPNGSGTLGVSVNNIPFDATGNAIIGTGVRATNYIPSVVSSTPTPFNADYIDANNIVTGTQKYYFLIDAIAVSKEIVITNVGADVKLFTVGTPDAIAVIPKGATASIVKTPADGIIINFRQPKQPRKFIMWVGGQDGTGLLNTEIKRNDFDFVFVFEKTLDPGIFNCPQIDYTKHRLTGTYCFGEFVKIYVNASNEVRTKNVDADSDEVFVNGGWIEIEEM